VTTRSSVANDQLGKAYTAAGLGAIEGHENRRREVYRLAYDAYITEINGAWKSACTVCSSKPGEAKEKLQKWLDKLRKKAQSAFFRYTTTEQDLITQEGNASNILRDNANLINGLNSVHNPGAAGAFKLPDCPKCTK
jgi:hypothetical protein